MRSQGSSLDHAFLKVDKSAHLPSRAVRAAGSCLLDRTSDELNLKDQRRNVTNSCGPLPIILHVVEIFPAGGQIDPHAHWRLFTVHLGICLQPNTAINVFLCFRSIPHRHPRKRISPPNCCDALLHLFSQRLKLPSRYSSEFLERPHAYSDAGKNKASWVIP